MPKCKLCSRSQGKLNKNRYCKPCYTDLKERNINDVDFHIFKTPSKNNIDMAACCTSQVNEKTREISEIEKLKETMRQQKERDVEYSTLLREHVKFLKDEINHKNTIIDALLAEIKYNHETRKPHNTVSVQKSDIIPCTKNGIYTQGFPSQTAYLSRNMKNKHDDEKKSECFTENNGWKVESRKSKKLEIITREVTLENPFSILENEEKLQNDEHITNFPTQTPTTPVKRRVVEPKKLCILSDSICKPINMIEFGKHWKYPNNVKRSYPGATATHIKHNVRPILVEDSPNSIIIHAGTNNVTKKSYQSGKEVFNEIMEIVEECKRGGITNVYVSGITCRPAYMEKIDTINTIIKENALKMNYKYIDNSNLKAHHLWKDNLHHNNEGTEMLAYNI